MAKKQIATFLGTQKGLLNVGEHVYAYSTQTSTASSGAFGELLNFTTGNRYIVSEITMFAGVNPTDPGLGITSNFKVSLNGEIVFYVNLDSAAEDHPSQAVVPVLIPPLTTVLIEANAGGSGWNPSVSIVGRVYDA